MRNVFTPLRLAVVGLSLLVITFVILVTGTTDKFLLIPDKAHPLAQLVTVPGATPPNDGGGIYYVDVLEKKASFLERLFPSIHPGASLVKHTDVTPAGVSDAQRIQADRLDMQLSQQVASAVALRALGFNVRIREGGVRVAAVYADSHARGKLRTGDVIVSLDGRRARDGFALRAALAKRKIGDVVRVGYLRDGARHEISVRTTTDPREPRQPIIGVLPQPALRVRVPFTIKFNLGNVGGPSAGLAFALQILEARGRDVDHGYRVAATGEILPDGTVGAIGGVEQKTFGARQSKVDVFLVPAGDNYRTARKYAHGLEVVPVKSFQQALRALATLPPKS